MTGKANSEAGDRKREAELKEGKVDGDTISFVEMLSIQDERFGSPTRQALGGRQRNQVHARGRRLCQNGNRGQARGHRSSRAATVRRSVRIKAGKSEPVKDADGNVWLADQGFEGGQTIERPDIQIANTKSPDLYRAEHYSMDSFSWPVPNGKYVVKLHFAETFEGITGPGQRVFSFNVQGREFKDFDVWVKAGGPLKGLRRDGPGRSHRRQNQGHLHAQGRESANLRDRNHPAIRRRDKRGGSRALPQRAAVLRPIRRRLQPYRHGPTVLKIDASKVTGKVSPMLYGLMTEEINFAYEGGIYGELIRNRSFKADAVVPRVSPETYEAGKYFRSPSDPTPSPGIWTVVGGASMVLDTNTPSERVPERQPQARRLVSHPPLLRLALPTADTGAFPSSQKPPTACLSLRRRPPASLAR